MHVVMVTHKKLPLKKDDIIYGVDFKAVVDYVSGYKIVISVLYMNNNHNITEITLDYISYYKVSGIFQNTEVTNMLTQNELEEYHNINRHYFEARISIFGERR